MDTMAKVELPFH